MLIVGGNQSSGGYEIANSIRYDKDASQYLRRTCGSSASSYTLSLWVKNCEPQGGDTTAIYWNGTGAKLNWEFNGSSQIYWYDPETRTTASYRDVSAWYHLVWKVSSNVGTMYINGVAAPGLTSVSSIDSLNSGNFIYIGSDNGGSPQNGYFAEVCFIDGTALDPTSFGEYDEDSGIWKPIDVSDLSFGSNGFYLDFEDSSALGNDVSGNNNDLTSAGFTSLNQTTDTPTNNFATLNSLDKASTITTSEGNTKASASASHSAIRATFGLNSGKWFWENKIDSVSGIPAVGVMSADARLSDQLNSTQSRWYRGNGEKFNNGTSSSYGASYTTGDIIGIALNLDDGEITFYKNGVSQGVAFTDLLSSTDESWLPAIKLYGEAATINTGNPSFTISSGNSDADGYGNFEYAVPSGYYALNTKNLAEYG